jgi:hypothetical protein
VASGHADDGFFKLPSALNRTPANGHEGPASTKSELITDQSAQEGTSEPDLWLSGLDGYTKPPELRSWDTYHSKSLAAPKLQFITEAGAEAFDSLLSSAQAGNESNSAANYQIVDANAYCASLLALALGRGSALFTWNDKDKIFVSVLGPIRVSGYSFDVLEGIKKLCMECGTISRALRAFIDRAYVSQPTPCRVALASAVNTILITLQSGLGINGQDARSLAQLQSLVRPVKSLLHYFKRLVVKLARSRSDEELLSLLFIEAQAVEHSEIVLRDAVREVLKVSSRPFLDFVEQWIGLAPESGLRVTKAGPGKAFVKVESRVLVDDMGIELEEPEYFFDEDFMPSFIPRDIGQSIFETGRNLRFLRENRPEHPLLGTGTTLETQQHMRWEFDWSSIARIECKALSYEVSLARAIESGKIGPSTVELKTSSAVVTQMHELRIFGGSEEQINETITVSMAELDRPLERPVEDYLGSVIRKRLFDSSPRQSASLQDFTPPSSLLPLLSFGPVVASQARIVGRECMKLLFKDFDVRQHLQLQRSFQLLGNGVFCSRLSHALFDPELAAAERKAGVALPGGVMGLRLGHRENWPPASSELRLALVDVLTDSYAPSGPPQGRRRAAKAELPGDLSFAVRDLSIEEMEQCMNPESLEALDFLRLSYKPPPALSIVITPGVLMKYDRIFKAMLRILRMQFVVNKLFFDATLKSSSSAQDRPAATRFILEAHHFVATITAYFFTAGIAAPWRRFEGLLDTIESDLDEPWSESMKSYNPESLREHHEGVLDEITAVLFLRKRHQPVLKLLEDIFRVVLDFSKSQQRGQDSKDTSPLLYSTFRKNVEVFMTVCRGLSEKGDSGRNVSRRDDELRSGSNRDVENTVSRLVLMLDMTGYYVRKSIA